jgi:predicted dehydrogenase
MAEGGGKVRARIALVGCGNFPFHVLYPMLRNLPLELTAVCDTDPAQRERFIRFFNAGKGYGDYREMIRCEKPEGVICVVDADTHYAAGKFCLENGVHVFVEKTPCQTAAQAEELAALQMSSGKYLAVGFNRRFAAAYMLTREIIRRREFGQVSMIYSKFNASQYQSTDYFIFNHIIHHIDLVRYLVGEIGDLYIQSKIHHNRSGAFALHFTAQESGAVGTIQAASMLEEAYPMERLDIAGTGGNVVVDNVRDLRYNRSGPPRDIHFAQPLEDTGDCLSWNLSGGYGVGRGIFSYLGFEAELAEFAAALSEGTRPSCTIEESVGTMRIMETVRRHFSQKA